MTDGIHKGDPYYLLEKKALPKYFADTKMTRPSQ